MNITTARLLGALITLALVAAACGSDEPTADQSAAEATSTEATTAVTDEAVTDDAMNDDAAMDDDHDDDGHDHDELEPIETALDLGLTLVSADVDGDAVTVTVEPSGDFSFVDDETGTANGHVDGEGHVHLYVDGEKVTRIYSPTYTHTGLAPGEHSIRVELSTNEHSPYSADGVVIDDMLSIEVGGQSDNVIDVSIVDGVAVDGVQEWDVPLGSTVSIRVAADSAHEVHVHGYDVLLDATPGAAAELNFVADIPGQFEVEIESTGQLIAELVVS